MKTSRDGIALIKNWEGCRLTAYPDPGTGGDPWTIGYGHTSAAGEPKVVRGLKITQQEADDILVRDLAKYEAAVDRALTRSPTQPQFDACVSLCYNIGQGAFAGSTVVRKFNAGDIGGAADAFLLWNKAGGKVMQGLVNRREAERLHFLKASASAPAQPVAPIAPVPAPSPPPAPESPPAAPAAPARPGSDLAAWVLGAAAALIAALAAWMMKG